MYNEQYTNVENTENSNDQFKGLTEEQKQLRIIALNTMQTKNYLRIIKNGVVFFVVLAVIGIISSIIIGFSVATLLNHDNGYLYHIVSEQTGD